MRRYKAKGQGCPFGVIPHTFGSAARLGVFSEIYSAIGILVVLALYIHAHCAGEWFAHINYDPTRNRVMSELRAYVVDGARMGCCRGFRYLTRISLLWMWVSVTRSAHWLHINWRYVLYSFNIEIQTAIFDTPNQKHVLRINVKTVENLFCIIILNNVFNTFYLRFFARAFSARSPRPCASASSRSWPRSCERTGTPSTRWTFDVPYCDGGVMSSFFLISTLDVRDMCFKYFYVYN